MKKGFTLIELTIVIAIIAALAAILIPNYVDVYNSAEQLEILDSETQTQLDDALNAIKGITSEE